MQGEVTVAFSHPLTGQMFNATTDDVRKALAETEEYLYAERQRLRNVYRQVDAMQEWLAENTDYTVPPRRNQTDTQRRIERCPRCRSVIKQAG